MDQRSATEPTGQITTAEVPHQDTLGVGPKTWGICVTQQQAPGSLTAPP